MATRLWKLRTDECAGNSRTEDRGGGCPLASSNKREEILRRKIEKERKCGRREEKGNTYEKIDDGILLGSPLVSPSYYEVSNFVFVFFFPLFFLVFSFIFPFSIFVQCNRRLGVKWIGSISAFFYTFFPILFYSPRFFRLNTYIYTKPRVGLGYVRGTCNRNARTRTQTGTCTTHVRK